MAESISTVEEPNSIFSANVLLLPYCQLFSDPKKNADECAAILTDIVSSFIPSAGTHFECSSQI
ncbi:hypothetical protein ACTXT7_013203 [Hymenolepis weldensis]